MTVLVVGDANVDLVLTGDVVPRFGQAEQLLDAASLVLGGSASIAACGIAKLGVPTSLVAVVGDDQFGRFQLEQLGAAGVRLHDVRLDRSAPTGISVHLSVPRDRAILTLLGTIPHLEPDDVLAAAERPGIAHVHFASYFLLPALRDAMPEMLDRLRQRGVTTSIDTNWDPAETWTGLDRVLPLIDVILPNAQELRAITGITNEMEAARALSAAGARVVVKDGADGGWSLGPDGTLTRAPGLAVDVVDTTGAGDSFDAGYLAAVASGVPDEATRLRWATVAGSLSVRAAGGTAGQAARAELLAAL
jgi:ribokinase